MKSIILLIAILTAPLLRAQASSPVPEKFRGHWQNKTWNNDSVSSDNLVVKKDSAVLLIEDQMIYLYCRPEYSSDTLYLFLLKYHYKYVGYTNPPICKKLFAKCYLKDDQLHITYLQKKYVKGLKTDSVLYKYIPHSLSARQEKFVGSWSETKLIEDGFAPEGEINITDQLVYFNVMPNQLFLYCAPRFAGDSLFLYAQYVECGRLFYPGNYPLPKNRNLFAKCYMKNSNLHVIYSQKIFARLNEYYGVPSVFYKFKQNGSY